MDDATVDARSSVECCRDRSRASSFADSRA
jgi:hypothetical protein